MSKPFLVTGAAGGRQGSTGLRVTKLLLERGIPVRAFVHTLDARSEALREFGAEVVAGDLLDPASVQAAMKDVRRAYFTYPVQEGLLEATTIFADAAAVAGLEFVVNNSQYQETPLDPTFRDLQAAASYRNLQHRLADRVLDWAEIDVAHIQAPPYYENVRALVSHSVAQQDAAFLPWGEGDAVIPLASAENVAEVAAALLLSPSLPAGKVYSLVTEALTVRQVFDTLGRAIGRPIRYVPITDEQWAHSVKERINAHAVDHLSHLWRYFRNLNAPRRTTNTVREVTGHAPQSLEEFFRINAESFALAKN